MDFCLNQLSLRDGEVDILNYLSGFLTRIIIPQLTEPLETQINRPEPDHGVGLVSRLFWVAGSANSPGNVNRFAKVKSQKSKVKSITPSIHRWA